MLPPFARQNLVDRGCLKTSSYLISPYRNKLVPPVVIDAISAWEKAGIEIVAE
jgi:hypothetical protein